MGVGSSSGLDLHRCFGLDLVQSVPGGAGLSDLARRLSHCYLISVLSQVESSGCEVNRLMLEISSCETMCFFQLQLFSHTV